MKSATKKEKKTDFHMKHVVFFIESPKRDSNLGPHVSVKSYYTVPPRLDEPEIVAKKVIVKIRFSCVILSDYFQT